MIDLLVSSLMVERGVEDALISSIAGEVHESTAASPKVVLDSSVPLLQLMQKLIANATVLKLAAFKQVGCLSVWPLPLLPHPLPLLGDYITACLL